MCALWVVFFIAFGYLYVANPFLLSSFNGNDHTLHKKSHQFINDFWSLGLIWIKTEWKMSCVEGH